MNISIPITDQVEAVLRRKAAECGEELGEYVHRLVLEEAEEEWPTPPSNETTEIFMQRLQSMIQRHAVRCGHVDDSRESIYAGRGE